MPNKRPLGKRIDRDVLCLSEHIMTCNICGDTFDLRDLCQVLHHEHTGIKLEDREEILQ